MKWNPTGPASEHDPRLNTGSDPKPVDIDHQILYKVQQTITKNLLSNVSLSIDTGTLGYYLYHSSRVVLGHLWHPGMNKDSAARSTAVTGAGILMNPLILVFCVTQCSGLRQNLTMLFISLISIIFGEYIFFWLVVVRFFFYFIFSTAFIYEQYFESRCLLYHFQLICDGYQNISDSQGLCRNVYVYLFQWFKECLLFVYVCTYVRITTVFT